VIITDINVSGGQKVASTMPEFIEFIKADVSQEIDWQFLVKTVFRKHGRVDCLVNNAGTTYPNKVDSMPLPFAIPHQQSRPSQPSKSI